MRALSTENATGSKVVIAPSVTLICCAPVYLHGQAFAGSERHVRGDAGRRRVSFEDCLFDHNA